jgi:parallel beta-helix repeat protein
MLGIFGRDSTWNKIHDNIFFNDGIWFYGEAEKYFLHDIQNNTVNGKQLFYQRDLDNFVVPSDCGQVFLVHCKNVIIKDMTFNSTDFPLSLAWCDDCEISNSNFSNIDGEGIWLMASNYNTIFNNILSDILLHGIALNTAKNNTIENNTITGDETFSGISMFNSCQKNTIKRNIIELQRIGIADYPSRGIWIRNSDLNYILDNPLISNCDLGIHMQYSGNNHIKRNSIVNNAINLFIEYSLYDKITENNIHSSKSGIELYSTSSVGFYPWNYWGKFLGPYAIRTYKVLSLIILSPWWPWEWDY